jgi:hypothetical protein
MPSIGTRVAELAPVDAAIGLAPSRPRAPPPALQHLRPLDHPARARDGAEVRHQHRAIPHDDHDGVRRREAREPADADEERVELALIERAWIR